MDILATTLTPGEKEAAIAGGVAGATMGMMMTFAVVWYVLTVIATWKIFQKAGEPGWKAIIPIYNIYVMYKIVNMKGWFWFLLATSVIGSIALAASMPANYANMTSAEAAAIDWGRYPGVYISILAMLVIDIWGTVVYAWRTSKVFGHGAGYFIGLLFLQPIFWLILGFDKSKYSKKNLKK